MVEKELHLSHMDYRSNNDNGSEEHWMQEDYCLQNNSNYTKSQCVWNEPPLHEEVTLNEPPLHEEVTLNEEDLSYMFDEATPVKACGDFAYHVNNNDNMNREAEVLRETSSLLKRRRMLQFNSQMVDSTFCNEELSSAFLKSNEGEDSLGEVLSQASEWPHDFPDVSVPSYEGLDSSSESWLTECFNDSEMSLSLDDMNLAGSSEFQIDISEFCNDSHDSEANVVQKRVNRTARNVVFKGTKSFLRTPTKLASSIAYPFAFIKPCAFHGDVTLKDINQRIRTPPPSKTKQNDEDPIAYPTSAFSGKPVVGKTKIRTEGGKGSITIMRTKG